MKLPKALGSERILVEKLPLLQFFSLQCESQYNKREVELN